MTSPQKNTSQQRQLRPPQPRAPQWTSSQSQTPRQHQPFLRPSKHLPSNMALHTKSTHPMFAGSKVNLVTYTKEQVEKCAGYISIRTPDGSSSSGQVCAISIVPDEAAKPKARRLLLQTSRHVLEDDDGKKSEPIFEEKGGKCVLKQGYHVTIGLPSSNLAWTNRTQEMEFFVTEIPEDIAFIVVDCENPPDPCINPDLNRAVIGGGVTNFYAIVYREKNRKFLSEPIEFSSTSKKLSDSLKHFEKTEKGDSGGMIYCYKTDENKLVPAAVITGSYRKHDYSLIFDINQSGAVRNGWRETIKILQNRLVLSLQGRSSN